MKSPKLIIGIVGVALLLLVVRIIVSIPGPDDRTQIEQALDQAIAASREGRPGGVMDKLSEHLTVNSLDASGNMGQIAKYVKDNHPDIVVTNRQCTISGDEATIESPVNLSLDILGQTRSAAISDVVMTFRKEDDHIYLVIPVKRWKLADVQLPESAITNLEQ